MGGPNGPQTPSGLKRPRSTMCNTTTSFAPLAVAPLRPSSTTRLPVPAASDWRQTSTLGRLNSRNLLLSSQAHWAASSPGLARAKSHFNLGGGSSGGSNNTTASSPVKPASVLTNGIGNGYRTLPRIWVQRNPPLSVAPSTPSASSSLSQLSCGSCPHGGATDTCTCCDLSRRLQQSPPATALGSGSQYHLSNTGNQHQLTNTGSQHQLTNTGSQRQLTNNGSQLQLSNSGSLGAVGSKKPPVSGGHTATGSGNCSNPVVIVVNGSGVSSHPGGRASSVTAGGGQIQPVGVNFRPHRDVPWWEIATRKMKHRSCPVPSQAHVVAAFEQSLSNMTNRFQALTQSAERKDSELNELRSTIEALRKHSVAAGLTSASFAKALESPLCMRRQPGVNGNGCAENRMSRQLSTDSMSSINSLSSACSAVSHASGNSSHRSSDTSCSSKKKKKKGWLRSSFSKAFSRSKKNQNGSVSDVEDLRHLQSDTSAPNSPLLNTPHMMNGGLVGIKTSHSSSAIYDKEEDGLSPEVVQELKKQLHEKDMVLTDIRLEALSSAHQLESLKETVNKMRSEMVNLKHDNQRLQRLVSNKSPTSSQSSLPITDNMDQRLSTSEMSATSSIDAILADATIERDSKRVTVSVFLCCHGDSQKMATAIKEAVVVSEVLIGSISVSTKTKWDLLDSLVRRAFKEYVLRVDPVSNLGLNAESVHSYHLGEVTITKDGELPELLPCGYLIGDCMNIKLMLKGTKQNSVDSLAFETLVPKSIVHRYMSLLTEHRRIILCGPSGTGKTYLAHKLAEFLVLRSGKLPTPGSIATFNVDHKSAKELRQYLSNVAEQCEGSNAADLPSVIILDNLHHVGSLGEVFNGFLSAKYQNCPYIIGTMNQATCSTTNLQLHHNFRWVLCANHMEPVKGFLGRHLRRKLVETEAKVNLRNNDLIKVIDWMPKVWQQLNKFLETHSSSDVTIGPRLFLSCPIDISASQVWFTDLWNYSVVPYLLEAVREGLQLYGRRAPWEDPTEWVIESYPWPSTGPTSIDWPSLLRMRPEDVGYEGHPGPGGLGAKSVCSTQGDLEGDPLLNMLMRLQEAASYSSPHSNDSDTTSLDSHCSSNQTEDMSGSGVGGGNSGANGIESTL